MSYKHTKNLNSTLSQFKNLPGSLINQLSKIFYIHVEVMMCSFGNYILSILEVHKDTHCNQLKSQVGGDVHLMGYLSAEVFF
jgi:hypothetical protein